MESNCRGDDSFVLVFRPGLAIDSGGGGTGRICGCAPALTAGSDPVPFQPVSESVPSRVPFQPVSESFLAAFLILVFFVTTFVPFQPVSELVDTRVPFQPVSLAEAGAATPPNAPAASRAPAARLAALRFVIAYLVFSVPGVRRSPAAFH